MELLIAAGRADAVGPRGGRQAGPAVRAAPLPARRPAGRGRSNGAPRAWSAGYTRCWASRNALAAFRSVRLDRPGRGGQQLAAGRRLGRLRQSRGSERFAAKLPSPQLRCSDDSWIISTTATASCTARTCPCPTLAEQYGTPLYVYSQATLLHHLNADADGLRRGRAAHLLQHQDQRQPPHLPADGRARLRLRRDLRRRTVPGPRGRRHRRRRSSSPASARPTPRCATRLENDVLLFNVESEEELHTLGDVAQGDGQGRPRWPCGSTRTCRPRRTPRPTPRVKGVKFGLDIETVLDVAQGVVGHPDVAVVGLHMHLGSPILTAEPYRARGRQGASTLIERAARAGAPDPST